MNAITLSALILFVSAIAIESLLRARFWKLLGTLHPKQRDHLRSPRPSERNGPPNTPRGARNLMIYLRDRNFRLSQDRGGALYCKDNRGQMLASYWATAISGCILLLAISVWGW
ncbi:hypothetical protein ABU614_15155 [Lysobacter firmicutimachus]|uniref:Uncharacterized protein n=1 Tax=Lysobacter firmicutimachus TaxID=1792846 RepID=A0AAU8MNU7_9GAMM|nr:hypothetical protein [Lysobacter antibioticus]